MSTPHSPATPSPPPIVDEVRDGLVALYAELDAAIATHHPACQLSGRCCRFEEYGHTLFLSAPEAAMLIAEAPDPVRPLDDGQTCPWQDARGRCVARDARPIGCRAYFCDPAYQEALPTISEEYISRLKEFVGRHGLPWDYAPLHQHLRGAVSEGRLRLPDAPGRVESPANVGQIHYSA